jgi:ribosomal protein S27AE
MHLSAVTKLGPAIFGDKMADMADRRKKGKCFYREFQFF